MPMWNGFGSPDGWEWLWMGVMMMFIWTPLLLTLAWAMRQFGPRGGHPGRRRDEAERDAVEIARRAYARGEISRERYLQLIDDLERAPQPPGVATER